MGRERGPNVPDAQLSSDPSHPSAKCNSVSEPSWRITSFSQSFQSFRHVWLFVMPWMQHVRLPCPSPTPRAYPNSCPLELVMPSNHPLLCCPLLLLPSVFPSIRVFSSESVLHIRWPKYWSISFSISPSNKYSRLISFRIDWLDLLAVQGTLKSSPTPQFKSINFSALSLLFGPTLTSIHNYWKNHIFD